MMSASEALRAVGATAGIGDGSILRVDNRPRNQRFRFAPGQTFYVVSGDNRRQIITTGDGSPEAERLTNHPEQFSSIHLATAEEQEASGEIAREYSPFMRQLTVTPAERAAEGDLPLQGDIEATRQVAHAFVTRQEQFPEENAAADEDAQRVIKAATIGNRFYAYYARGGEAARVHSLPLSNTAGVLDRVRRIGNGEARALNGEELSQVRFHHFNNAEQTAFEAQGADFITQLSAEPTINDPSEASALVNSTEVLSMVAAQERRFHHPGHFYYTEGEGENTELRVVDTSDNAAFASVLRKLNRGNVGLPNIAQATPVAINNILAGLHERHLNAENRRQVDAARTLAQRHADARRRNSWGNTMLAGTMEFLDVATLGATREAAFIGAGWNGITREEFNASRAQLVEDNPVAALAGQTLGVLIPTPGGSVLRTAGKFAERGAIDGLTRWAARGGFGVGRRLVAVAATGAARGAAEGAAFGADIAINQQATQEDFDLAAAAETFGVNILVGGATGGLLHPLLTSQGRAAMREGISNLSETRSMHGEGPSDNALKRAYRATDRFVTVDSAHDRMLRRSGEIEDMELAHPLLQREISSPMRARADAYIRRVQQTQPETLTAESRGVLELIAEDGPLSRDSLRTAGPARAAHLEATVNDLTEYLTLEERALQEAHDVGTRGKFRNMNYLLADAPPIETNQGAILSDLQRMQGDVERMFVDSTFNRTAATPFIGAIRRITRLRVMLGDSAAEGAEETVLERIMRNMQQVTGEPSVLGTEGMEEFTAALQGSDRNLLGNTFNGLDNLKKYLGKLVNRRGLEAHSDTLEGLFDDLRVQHRTSSRSSGCALRVRGARQRHL